MSNPNQKKFGLVLSAGGARAAYQVGVLHHLSQHCPRFQPTVLSGISAGAINACFLAQGEPFQSAGPRLYRLWQELEFNQIFKTNFKSTFGLVAEILNDLFLSKLTRRLLFRSVLNAAPLANTLSHHLRFTKMWKAIVSGQVEGLSITTTNYQTGDITIFYDSTRPIPPWPGKNRLAIRTSIRPRHIVASCSIPIIFEPIRIGDQFFGDGSLRFSHPFSPAIHLGATHLLGISANASQCVKRDDTPIEKPSLGFMSGLVLDSIFQNTIAPDYQMLCRFNEIAKTTEAVKPIHASLLCPSVEPGLIAKEFFSELPFNFRQLIKAAAIKPNESGELLSYLLFSPGYLRAMLELGEKDAAANHDKLETLINS